MSSTTSSNTTTSVKSEVAKTTRALRRAWQKCIRSEELSRFLGDLLTEGVGVPKDEEYLISEDGRRKAGKMGEKGKAGLREKMMRGKLSDANKSAKRNKRIALCSHVRDDIRNEYKSRVAWLKNKYITKHGTRRSYLESLPCSKTVKYLTINRNSLRMSSKELR